MTKTFRAASLLLGAVAAVGLAVPSPAETRPVSLAGQVSGWASLQSRDGTEGIAGFRYIPTLSLAKSFPKFSLDAEASVNVFGTLDLLSSDGSRADGRLKPYRIWGRFSTSRFEARLGLQKVNFGSAALLRPLMWFARIDPNDPLQLTDGVTGLLLKYTFRNNANVWLWGLYGNDETKGWEAVPSRRTSPEFGGRVQTPVPAGEVALTFHHRRMDAARSLIPLPYGEDGRVPEDRLGLDGKWDIGPGVWFEAALIRQGWSFHPQKYQRMINVGADFTFGLGHGLHVLAEHLDFTASTGPWRGGTFRRLTALLADYPLGLLDRVRAVVFRDWTAGDWYRILTWQRTYDRWSFFLIGFWNPETYRVFTASGGGTSFAGKGLQLMVVFNH
ncbi:MAG: hypothetical protein FJY82_01455 [Candidatus Aminicenantes bacterium]|nr:hypothetical protein [Candidatus Aminicenantes bacterium]